MYRDWACSWEKTHIPYRWKGRGREVQTKLYFSVCWRGACPCAAGDEITAEHWRGGGHSIWLPFPSVHPHLWKPMVVSKICNAFIQILPFSPYRLKTSILTSLPKFHWSHPLILSFQTQFQVWLPGYDCPVSFWPFKYFQIYSTLFLLVHCYSQCSWMYPQF